MVLDLLLIGLAIAVFPLSVTAFVLVLSARGGIWKGLAFILARLACFVAVLAVVLLSTGGKPPAPKSPPSTPRPPSSSPSAWDWSGSADTGTGTGTSRGTGSGPAIATAPPAD